MLFNSYLFILLFLPVTLLVYFAVARWRYGAGKLWLFAASSVFYGYMNPSYVVFLWGNILVNYWLGGRLAGHGTQQSSGERGPRSILILALVLNLGTLFVFKYYNFFVANINQVFASDLTLLRIAVPLGISFITFQQIAYLVDCWRREIPRYSLLDYGVFVSFFPKVISGPIALHGDVIPQFQEPSNARFQWDHFAKGIYAFSCGLAKKMILASAFGAAADYGYDLNTNLTATTAILTILAYTFQLYFDFSGYCDMACGIGWMFNIPIPINFNSPYKALSVNDFWKRWHMTLTSFFTKYLYIPLGGSRKGAARTYVNSMIVFLCSGLWHGAAWTFVLWGAMHGIGTVIDRAGRNFLEKVPRWIRWAVTFAFVNAAWVYFRSGFVWQANGILKRALTGGITGVPAELSAAFLLPELKALLEPLLGWVGSPVSAGLLCLVGFYAFAFWAVLCTKNTMEQIECFVPTVKKALLCAFLLFWSICSLTQVTSFVYFNF